MTRTVNLTDDIRWLFECHSVGNAHMHLSQYIIRNNDRHILVDAGLDYDEYLKDAIQEHTDGQGIDALLLTQSILPHTRSANAVLENWEDVDVISAAGSPAMVGLRDARSKVMNTTEEVVDRKIRFLDPLLTDIVNSNWLFDVESGVLFTAEGFGHYHEPGACTARSSDLEDGISFEHIHTFQRDKLPFLQYVDVAKLRSAIDDMFDGLDVSLIAPVHGTPVHRSDIDVYLDSVVESAGILASGDGDGFADN